jgi:hypothetical protein
VSFPIGTSPRQIHQIAEKTGVMPGCVTTRLNPTGRFVPLEGVRRLRRSINEKDQKHSASDPHGGAARQEKRSSRLSGQQ